MPNLLIALDLTESVKRQDAESYKNLKRRIDLSYTKADFRSDMHKLFLALYDCRLGQALNIYEEMHERVELVQAQKEVWSSARTQSGLRIPHAPWSDDGSPRFARELHKLKPSFCPHISAIALGALSLRRIFYPASARLDENLDAIAQSTLLSAASVIALKPNLNFFPVLERQSVTAGLVAMAAGTLIGAPLLCGLAGVAAAKTWAVYNAYKNLA